jgi:iron(III) transport system permease protein
MMPGIVLGIGFLWAFSLLPVAVPIYGTLWALFLAYMALATPVAVRIMSGAYAQLSYDLEECSRVHGATWMQTLWKIMVALAWPSFAVGWVLTFFGMLRELSASILLYSAGNEVLSVLMLQMWAGGKPEEVSVIALFMLGMVLVFKWVQNTFLNKRFNKMET